MPKPDKDSIFAVINKLNKEYYLPAIQRDFVWKPEQIEMLFDSLLKDYPIGSLLFWKIPDKLIRDIKLYGFVHDYKFGVSGEESPGPRDEATGLIAVLDGQQRLTAFNIGMRGSYTFSKPGEKEAKKRFLYLNLLYPHYNKDNTDAGLETDEAQNDNGGFRFLTESEAEDKNNENTCWCKVNRIIQQNKNDTYYAPIVDEIINTVSPVLKKCYDDKKSMMCFNVAQTHFRLLIDFLLPFTIIESMTLDEVTDIFVRVNSGGTQLDKTDFLFSLVAASWRESRNEFKELINELDFKAFNNDFIMRCCLAICLHDPSIKARQLTRDKIKKIQDKWERIKKAIKECTTLLKEWGFDSDKITGTNAVIPIVYCIYAVHEKQIEKLSDSFKEELRKSFVTIMLTARFSQGTDKEVPRLIKAMEKVLNDDSRNSFTLQKVSAAYAANNEAGKSKGLEITREMIEDLLITPKSSPKAFILLSLFDPKYNPIYMLDVDHMHPKAAFRKDKFKKLAIPSEKLEEWKNKKEQLPNLQILEGIANKEKSDTPLAEWVADKYSQDEDRNSYLRGRGLIGCSLDLKDFDTFFETRKSFLREKLAEYFGVDLQKS